MENTGYVKIYRKSLNSSVWKNPNIFMVWVWCLLKASHKTNKFPFNGSDIKLEKGQFITGIQKAINEIPITAQTYRTCIAYLKSTGRITTKSTNKFTIISIIKWNEYQTELTGKITNKLTNHQQTTNKPLTTYNNGNNGNNDKNISKDIDKSFSSKEIIVYGNPDINKIITYLKEKLGGSPDGSQKDNRRFANLLIKKFKKDYPDKDSVESICQLIDIALQDSFHSKNATSFKYLYYNSQKIIQSFKGQFIKPNIVKVR